MSGGFQVARAVCTPADRSAPRRGRRLLCLTPTVLIVDDDESVRTLLVALVQREGFEPDTAGDGMEAIAKLRRHRYDALILDIMLPLANGFDVIRFMSAERRDMLQRTVVVTAVSNHTLGDFNAPVRALLRKPFDIFDLTAALRCCVEAYSNSDR